MTSTGRLETQFGIPGRVGPEIVSARNRLAADGRDLPGLFATSCGPPSVDYRSTWRLLRCKGRFQVPSPSGTVPNTTAAGRVWSDYAAP